MAGEGVITGPKIPENFGQSLKEIRANPESAKAKFSCPKCGVGMFSCSNCGHQGCVACGYGRENLTLWELEAQHIRAVLVRSGGNVRVATAILGIGKLTLYRKMTHYGIARVE